MTQNPYYDLSIPHNDQGYEPLAFYSGRFSEVQISSSTVEEEAFAVLASCDRAHWLAASPSGFDLYTDNNNLIFIFDRTSIQLDISQGSLRNVLRWAVQMSMYDYICIHIRGTDNIWAHVFTRWTIPVTISCLVSIPPLPISFADEF